MRWSDPGMLQMQKLPRSLPPEGKDILCCFLWLQRGRSPASWPHIYPTWGTLAPQGAGGNAHFAVVAAAAGACMCRTCPPALGLPLGKIIFTGGPKVWRAAGH